MRQIMEKTTIEELCEGLPSEIKQYMEYCRTLSYSETPDYNHLKRLFKEKFVKEGYQYDNIYDWILIPLRLKDTELSNRVPISRFAKKEDTSLSMCNCDYDFGADLAYEEKTQAAEKEKEKVVVGNTKDVRQSNPVFHFVIK